MSKWVEIRDAVEQDIQMSGITEEVRKNILAVLANEAVPAVEAFLNKFAAGVQAEAANETGWCKVRDAVVIPYAIQAIMWVSKYVINRTLAETQPA